MGSTTGTATSSTSLTTAPSKGMARREADTNVAPTVVLVSIGSIVGIAGLGYIGHKACRRARHKENGSSDDGAFDLDIGVDDIDTAVPEVPDHEDAEATDLESGIHRDSGHPSLPASQPEAPVCTSLQHPRASLSFLRGAEASPQAIEDSS